MSVVILIWRSMRPAQWTKNAFVLAPLIFARKAFEAGPLALGLGAALLFCLASGSTYIFNDLIDRRQDRNHPLKGRRPIASGALMPSIALTAAVALALVSVILSFLIGSPFGLAILIYLGLGLAYSAFLKKVVIIDAMAIAAGFVLRVLGGAMAVDVETSRWLFLCTILLALFLGFGKRRHELVLLENMATEHRQSLQEYSPYFLDQMMAVVTSSTVVAYSFYTISPEVAAKLGTNNLYLTIPFVLYGIFRYLYLIHQKDMGGSPTAALLTDGPLLTNVILWLAMVITLLYFKT